MNTNNILIKCYNHMQGVEKILLFLLFHCIYIILLRLLLSLFALTWNAEVYVTEIWISCGEVLLAMEDILYYEALLIYILLRIRKKAQKCTLLSGTIVWLFWIIISYICTGTYGKSCK